jgi:hypothetical protein
LGGHADRNSPFLTLAPRSLFANEIEAQGFKFFNNATETQLAAALQKHGWTPPFLQLSHQDPAIRHAVIANGIMSRRYQASELSASMDPETNILYQVALQQYGKAVACFRSRLEAVPEGNLGSLETIPACFLLLIMFEFMQGNAAGLIMHLRNTASLKTIFGMSRQAQSFTQLLAFIEMVAAMWLDLDWSHSNASSRLQRLKTCQGSSASHYDLDTLYHDLVNIKNDVMVWRHGVTSARTDTRAHAVSLNSLPAVTRQTIKSQLDTWYQRFTTIPTNKEDKITARCALLRVNYLGISLAVDAVHQRQLSAQLSRRDSDLSEVPLDKDFCEIIELTEAVLKAGHSFSRYDGNAGEESLEAAGLLPLFSFRHSFIQPLFYVAQHAPILTLRQRAIHLLLEKPWREGAWESYVMGSIAKHSLGEHQNLEI